MASPLVLCLLAYFALAGNLQETQVPSDWAGKYQQLPTSWRNLRLHIHYNDTKVNSAAMDHLKTEVMARVVRWYEKVLKVPPVSGAIKVPVKYCVQGLVPSSHNVTGVDADVVLYVVTVPASTFLPVEANAYGAPCLVSGSQPQRVVAGAIWLRMDWLAAMSLESQVQAVARTVAQTLAFSPLLFPYFSKPDGPTFEVPEVIKFDSLGGIGAYFIALPTVLKRARAAFACPSLPGVRLAEVEPYNRNFTSMWSSRMMLDDFMSDRIVNRPSYSDVTMAVFQDSGWYDVQWQYTNPVQFLYHRGCSAFTSPCIYGGAAGIEEFCVSGSDVCGATMYTKGGCGIFDYVYGLPSMQAYLADFNKGGYRELDYCPVGTNEETCLEGLTAASGEEKCSECRCLEGTYQSSNSHCFRVECDNGQATVQVGDQVLACPTAGGVVDIPGDLGRITCPPVDNVCNIAPCKNLCSGYGKCLRSGCACEKGHSGDDCSIACDISCGKCSGPRLNDCTLCRPGATLVSHSCVCESGLTMNSAGVCMASGPCHAICLTCSGALATQCTSCHFPAEVSEIGGCECPEGSALSASGLCVTCADMCRTCQASTPSTCLSCFGAVALNNGSCACDSGAYFDLYMSQCLACDASCLTCKHSSTTCISCPNRQVVLNGKCVCPTGTYLADTECESCHPNCLSCANPTEAGCLSCRSEAYLERLSSPCYCRSTSGQCTLCHQGCRTCQGSGQLECATCHENASVDPFTKKCHCNDGFYPSPDVLNCAACHSICYTCLAGDPHSCLSCYEGSYFTGSSCTCQNRFFFDETIKKCENCPNYCNFCTAGLCKQCISGFNFDANETCALMDGLALDSATNTTYSCALGCKHCSYDQFFLEKQSSSWSTPSNCTECYESMELTAVNICNCPPCPVFREQFNGLYKLPRFPVSPMRYCLQLSILPSPIPHSEFLPLRLS